MSRKTGRSKRLRLYDRGNIICPICLTEFTRDQVSSGKTVTLEHVPIKALGGQARCLTCENCNAQAGRGIDQEAAKSARYWSRDWGEYEINIRGKRRKFKLSSDGKPIIHPLAGYSKQELQNLQNSESGGFTIGIRFPNENLAGLSSLKSAYLAMFSLLGSPGGYSYIRGDDLKAVRQRLLEPLQDNGVSDYVIKAPDGVSLNDIMLVNEPLSCWVVKIADHLVFLPLCGDSLISHPLVELKSSRRGELVKFKGLASWSFSTFGKFRTISVHLPGADTADSLVGLLISGLRSTGRPLEGICINHSGESATLLCPA